MFTVTSLTFTSLEKNVVVVIVAIAVGVGVVVVVDFLIVMDAPLSFLPKLLLFKN